MRSLTLLTLLALTPLLATACTSTRTDPGQGFVAGNCHITVVATNPSTVGLGLSFGSTDAGATLTGVLLRSTHGELNIDRVNGGVVTLGEYPSDSTLDVVLTPGAPPKILIDENAGGGEVVYDPFPSNGTDGETAIAAHFRDPGHTDLDEFVILIRVGAQTLRVLATSPKP